MAGRTPLHVFRNVPVVPVTAVHRHVALGGPIWPDFAVQTAVRHWRGGLPVDAEPMAWPATNEVDQPAVWGGFLDKAFGHFVAEHENPALHAKTGSVIAPAFSPCLTPPEAR